MNWINILQDIFNVCIVPLLGLLTTYVVNYIKIEKENVQTKTQNELTIKYSTLLADIITDCVIATNQTYVDSLKANGKFDKDAQIEAFNRTKAAVMDILSDEAKEHLNEIYGDLETYIRQQIETVVYNSK